MTDRSALDRLRIDSQACAHIVVQTPVGNLTNGTSFHIGDGYCVTDRHALHCTEESVPATKRRGPWLLSAVRCAIDRVENATPNRRVAAYAHLKTLGA
jgi:hypothetical protein